MDNKYEHFLDIVKSDVSAMVYSEGNGASYEDKFTEYCIEKLEEIGKSEGARVLSYIHPDTQGRIEWKINGYCLSDESKEDSTTIFYETLDLIITYFDNNSYDYNIPSTEYTKSINQVKKFLNSALKGHINYIDTSHSELNNLIKIISTQANSFDRVNIIFFINGSSNYNNETIKLKGFDSLDINIHVWDVKRFYKLYESNSSREPILIDFKEVTKSELHGIQCLKVPELNEMYECYLAIIRGDILANLYKNHSNELLESNVRAFLGQAGKYNKGIRDTIRENSSMFLPYNNGITATAESVETKLINNQLFITKLSDFQIVNGGQTTASLFHTQKKYNIDLSNIYVQMKLTVIKDVEQKNIEVPNIARFANSQNKVTELDLSSNNPFFVDIEKLSRRKYVVNPNNRNQSTLWFFERVNGQYREALNKTNKKNEFKEQNPISQKILKSDVAKYINIWDQEPHYVSQASQKNFIQYMKKIKDANKKSYRPGDKFYKKLIANAILFKTVDKLFGRRNSDAIGDTNLKIFATTYTLSYFNFKTDNRLDLWRIYDEQSIDTKLEVFLKELLILVFNYITETSSNTLISEYVKRETTWTELKSKDFGISFERISEYLVEKSIQEGREIEDEIVKLNIEEEVINKDTILSLGLKFWDGLKIYIRNNNLFDQIEIDLLDLIHNILNNKNLTNKNQIVGKMAMKIIDDNNIDIEIIKSVSLKKDSEEAVISLKSIYDRINLLSIKDWKKFIDLITQTKSGDEMEISNLKSVSNMILKKDKSIRENSLIKAHELLLRTSKRFKIKY